MRNRLFLFIPLIIIVGVIQITLLDSIKIFWIKPDLLLICVVFFSLILRLTPALALSITAGVFKDIFATHLFGINTVLFCLWGFWIVKLSRDLAIENNFLRVTLVLIVAVIHNVVTGLVLVYCGSAVPLGIFLRMASLSPLYTALISLPVFRVSKPVFS